jgi:lysophospholipase L1-like esterase
MNDFQNKSIFFIGDSITAEGLHIKYLRTHFENTKTNIYLHNKGIPGGRMDMVEFWLDEEFSSLTPEFAVVALGVNDLRIMLYDSAKEETADLLSQRQHFIGVYKTSLENVVINLKNRGITPIVCSPFCVNEHLEETGEIQTVVDNSDKKDIKETFYTKKTFRKINEGLKKMRDIAYEISKKLHVEFWDTFTQTLASVTSDCYAEDGIHYTDKGHELIAKIMLKEIANCDLKTSPISQKTQEIARLEFEERSYYFIKYIVLHETIKAINGDYDLITETKRWIAKNGHIDGVTEERELALLKYATSPLASQQALIAKIKS